MQNVDKVQRLADAVVQLLQESSAGRLSAGQERRCEEVSVQKVVGLPGGDEGERNHQYIRDEGRGDSVVHQGVKRFSSLEIRIYRSTDRISRSNACFSSTIPL